MSLIHARGTVHTASTHVFETAEMEKQRAQMEEGNWASVFPSGAKSQQQQQKQTANNT